MKTRLTASGVGLTRVEHGISPPMATCVTIPLKTNGLERGLTCYVCTSAFSNRGMGEQEVVDAARRVAQAINAADMTMGLVDPEDFRAAGTMKELSDERFAEVAGLYLSQDAVLDALVKAAPAAAPLVAALVDRLRRRHKQEEE